ncbi:UDP-glucose flavonoid 3-O-glucosyltransferase 7-like [Sesbania bispinosa]|nr:UDP-glucose flavonoid 3-O-glucosyltransferase 7-like [Sesbania bispinosa]
MTWPVHSEQFYNEKLITEVQGIGVEVGAEEWGSSGYGERNKLVRREQIEKAVRKLMDGGDEAEEIRRRARQLAIKAREAVGEGGSSQNNLTALIHYLKHLRDVKLTTGSS